MKSSTTTRKRIDIESILSTPVEVADLIPVKGKLESLPLDQLTWSRFEALSLHIFENTYRKIPNHDFGEAFRYGEEGQAQHGLDLLIKNLNSSKYIVAECKHLAKITASTITNIKKKFLSGDKFKESEAFILCTTHDLRDTKLVDELTSLETDLKAHNIRVELWGKRVITERLRSMFSTVEIFFGTEYALNFCTTPSPILHMASEFKTKDIQTFFRGWKISNKTCSMTIFTPSEDEHHLSCGIEFARHDLNGINLAVNSKTFIELIQHHHNSLSLFHTEFILDHTDRDKFILTLSGAQLTLSKSEVDDLDWVVGQCWSKTYESFKLLDASWKATRFNRLSTSEPTFALCRIESWFWSDIMRYCDAHDYEGGTSDLCIFDAAPNCLKVFVPNNTKDLDFGYHVVMYAYEDGGIFLNKQYVTLGWSPLKDIQGLPVAISPRKAWNAETTHHWLLNDLLPKVKVWANARFEQSTRKKRLSLFSKKQKIDFRPLNSFAQSAANFEPNGIGYRLASVEEARTLTHLLQTHFSAFSRSPGVSFLLIKKTLQSCLLIANKLKTINWHYIRGNLNLDQNHDPIISINEIINTDIPEKFATTGYLNHSLRCVYELLNGLSELDSVTLDQLSDNLRPLWMRFEEDNLFKTYS